MYLECLLAVRGHQLARYLGWPYSALLSLVFLVIVRYFCYDILELSYEFLLGRIQNPIVEVVVGGSQRGKLISQSLFLALVAFRQLFGGSLDSFDDLT